MVDRLKQQATTAGTNRLGTVAQVQAPTVKPASISTMDVVKSLPSGAKVVGGGLLSTFLPGLTNFVKKTGGILGEGVAYATNKNVREQYAKGNLEVMPTVSNTTQKSLALSTGAAMIETAILKSFPKLTQMTLAQRGGAGALQGVGAAVAEGMANEKTPEEIVRSLPSYGVAGTTLAIVSPYLLPILKSKIGSATPEVKNMLKGIVQEAKNHGIKPPVMPEVPPASTQVITEDGTPTLPIKKATAEIPARTPEKPVEVVRTTEEFQSVTQEKFRQEAIRRGLDDPGEVPFQKVQHNVDRWRKADAIAERNPQEALDMINGKLDVEGNLNEGDLYGALKVKLLNDPEYARANPQLVRDVFKAGAKGSKAGQALQAFDRSAGDTDPFTAMKAVTKARTAKAVGTKVTTTIKNEVKVVRQEIDKAQIKLEQALKAINDIRIC